MEFLAFKIGLKEAFLKCLADWLVGSGLRSGLACLVVVTYIIFAAHMSYYAGN
jgi:hypothetical protein